MSEMMGDHRLRFGQRTCTEEQPKSEKNRAKTILSVSPKYCN